LFFFCAEFGSVYLWPVFAKTYIIPAFFWYCIALQGVRQVRPCEHFGLVDNLLKTQALRLYPHLYVGKRASNNLRHLLAEFAQSETKTAAWPLKYFVRRRLRLPTGNLVLNRISWLFSIQTSCQNYRP